RVKWLDWQFQEALADAHLATEVLPASKEGREMAHLFYGFYLMQAGHPDEALKHYRIAARLAPSNPQYQHHLGHPYFVKRQFDQALHYYQTSLDMESRQATAHYWKGRVFEEMGKFEEAIDEFESQERAAEKYTADKKVFFDQLRDAVQQNGAEGYLRKRLELALKESHQELYEIATLYARLGD